MRKVFGMVTEKSYVLKKVLTITLFGSTISEWNKLRNTSLEIDTLRFRRSSPRKVLI